MRVGHLQSIPTTGKYKTGDTFAISGNSGMSTGPHVHLDLWHRGFDLSVINSKNFREWTLDFEAWYNKNRHPL
jgi:murein DD-endopeptidase MepM/ murein hydrolase activator NlpD